MRFDSLDALPGLLPGAYSGIDFHVLDTSSEPGRRVLEYLFPGVDDAAYDDFGVLPNLISIEALIIGDDYKAKAARLQRAFETAGPATLMHPWLGPMTVMMDEPALISFSSRELRVARISARFKKVLPGSRSGASLFAAGTMISSIVALASLLASAVGTRVISATQTAAVTRSARIVSAAIGAQTSPPGAAGFLPGLRFAILKSTPGTPAEYAEWIGSAAAMFGVASFTPAVAPAAEAAAAQDPSPESLATISRSLAATLTSSAGNAPSDADRALLVATAAQFLAQGTVQAGFMSFASRREALDYRASMLDAIDKLIETLEGFGGTVFQAETSALVGQARDLQTAIVSDINEVIGRLPDVLVFRTAGDLDAWQLALHVAGDTPSRIEAVYQDIIARNNPRHPAAMEAGSIEVAEPD
ncbi:DNA circularization N-terminal domain-containing protein [Hoeflea sp.]|uniref:DNA circularization N-terminal domain-containing protein n=1 Tax=Hoeflea sp. TaxID=1940281 RepID=UPI003A8CD64D